MLVHWLDIFCFISLCIYVEGQVINFFVYMTNFGHFTLVQSDENQNDLLRIRKLVPGSF